MKRKSPVTTSTLEREINDSKQAAVSQLKERWRALYLTEPPRRISRDLLIRALAYRMQEQAHVGLGHPLADCCRGSLQMPRHAALFG